MSPTQRSMRWLEEAGWLVAIVERRIPHTMITIDLYGLGDLLAIRGAETLLVQVTSGSNHAARIKKARASQLLSRWCDGGRRFVVHSWSKRGARGKRKTYQLREEFVE